MIHELYVFLSAIGCGCIAGFIYDLIRLKRKALKTQSFMIGLEDIAYWIFSALLVFTTAYLSNQGELRFYFFIGAVIGVALYYWLFSRWVIQILTFLVKVIVWPFAAMFHLLKTPVLWLFGIIGKKTAKAKKRLNLTRVKINRRFKSIGHIIRKI